MGSIVPRKNGPGDWSETKMMVVFGGLGFIAGCVLWLSDTFGRKKTGREPTKPAEHDSYISDQVQTQIVDNQSDKRRSANWLIAFFSVLLICLPPFGLVVGVVAIVMNRKTRGVTKYVCLAATILSAIITGRLLVSIATGK